MTAACAVAVTVKVFTTGLAVTQPRVFDHEDLSARSVQAVLGRDGVTGLSGEPKCPSGLLVEEGVTFTCEMNLSGRTANGSRQVRFRVTNADGGGFEYTELLPPRQ
ncbi:DUF4333 domain-containing protein [Saccharothrix sp.]|uniref:DUF4333 domain-containing protein n=1 Tax=Saccharothrix sp. TaxID=1873460 RepID=UPI0028113FB2|nr:DUF4333 domain-containing protein [Saccharothrix sp.]